MKLQLKTWLGLRSSEVLMRVGESTSMVVYPHGWQVCGVGWQDSSFPPHESYYSIELLTCPHEMEAGFPQGKKFKQATRKLQHLL